MTEDQFWQLIAKSQYQSTNCESQAQELQHLLFDCSAQEIIAFDRIFRQKVIDTYRWDLWGIACLIQGSCSTQGFQNFCAWLVGQGHDTYHKILDDPQTILSIIEEDEELLGCATLLQVSAYAYDDVVGDEMPPAEVKFPTHLSGDPISEDALAERFPKVAAVFVK